MPSESKFVALETKLKARGAKHPAALAAYIGRKKYGRARFEEMEQEGKEEKKEE